MPRSGSRGHYKPYATWDRQGSRNALYHDIRKEGQQIIDALRGGNRFGRACDLAGISRRTVFEWRRLGRLELGSKLPNGNITNEDHIWFEQEVNKALAQFQSEVLNSWFEAAKTNWQAARDLLARRFPSEWGATEQRQIEITGGQQMQLELVWGDEDEGERAQHDTDSIASIAHEAEGSRLLESTVQGGGSGATLGQE